MRIFLVGLPGSGKSTLGKKMASALNLTFKDLDTLIEQGEGSTIKHIFETQGETYFREQEAKYLRLCCAEKDFILATGGGAACFHDNMAVMNASGITIFLDVPVDALAQRILDSKHQDVRPMAAGKTKSQLLELLQDLYQRRLPYYTEAKFVFNGTQISDKEVVKYLQDYID